MITKIIPQYKIKLSNPLHVIISNKKFLVCLQSQKKIFRIRHLYCQTTLSTFVDYSYTIKKIIITSSDYLVIWTQSNSLEILKIQIQKQKIVLKTIKACIKKELKNVYAQDVRIVCIKKNKIEILVLNNEKIVENSQELVDIESVCFGMTNIYFYNANNNCIYTYCNNQKISMFQEKKKISCNSNMLRFFVFQTRFQDIFIQIYSDYIKITRENQINNQKYQFSGVIMQCFLKNNLLTLITSESTQHMYLYVIDPLIYQSNAHKVIYRQLTYELNSIGTSFSLFNSYTKDCINYLKKQKNIVCKDKIDFITENTSTLIYALNEKQNNRIDILKIDHKNVLSNKFTSIINPQKIQINQINQKNQQEKSIKIQVSQNFFQLLKSMIDKKLQPILKKIEIIQQKINSFESKLSDKYIQSVYQKSFEKELSNLFELRLLPILQNNFSQLFKQVRQIFEVQIKYSDKKLINQKILQQENYQKLLDHMVKSSNKTLLDLKQSFMSCIKVQKLLDQQLRKKKDTFLMINHLLQEIQKGPFCYPKGNSVQIVKISQQNSLYKQIILDNNT